MRYFNFFLFLALAALSFSGCAGYRVGSTLDPAIKTIGLSVINKTDEPSIEVAVKKALIREFQMDGRLEVCSQADADVVLCVTLKHFDLQSLAFNRRQGSLTEEYRMKLTASAVLSNAENSEVLLESPVVFGESDLPYTSDLTSTKRNGLQGAADDLACKVFSTVVTAW